jgi:hypothetical protein
MRLSVSSSTDPTPLEVAIVTSHVITPFILFYSSSAFRTILKILILFSPFQKQLVLLLIARCKISMPLTPARKTN